MINQKLKYKYLLQKKEVLGFNLDLVSGSSYSENVFVFCLEHL